MALSVSCTCCTLVKASAECCRYLCYPATVRRLWPLWSNPVPLSLIRCTCIVPSFLGCYVIRHMVLIALNMGRSYDSHWDLIASIIGYLNSDLTVKTVYLYGELKDEIYMAQPEGFIKSGQEHKVCKLIKSIYGLKQARRVWYETISKTLQKKLGFQQLHSDAGVHVLHQWEGDHEIILILYIDDLLIMGNSQPMIHSIKKQLMAAYQMKDLGAATSYLGIWITRDHKQQSIWIDHEDYIYNALTRFNLLNANDTKTPLPEGVYLVTTTEPTPPEKLTRYCQIGIERSDYLGHKISVGVARLFPRFRAISTMWRMTQHPRNEGTRYVHRIRDKGTGFDHKGHSLLTTDG